MDKPGNTAFWNVYSSFGKSPEIVSSEQLWSIAEEYFSWVETNPIKVDRVFSYRGKSEIRKIEKARPMSLGGFCLFVGISKKMLVELGQKPDFVETVQRIEDVIYEQKFSGAVVELFNSSVISRELGLIERHELAGTDIHTEVNRNELSAHELALAMFKLVREGQKEQARVDSGINDISNYYTENQDGRHGSSYVSVDEDDGECFIIHNSEGTDCGEQDHQ